MTQENGWPCFMARCLLGRLMNTNKVKCISCDKHAWRYFYFFPACAWISPSHTAQSHTRGNYSLSPWHPQQHQCHFTRSYGSGYPCSCPMLLLAIWHRHSQRCGLPIRRWFCLLLVFVVMVLKIICPCWGRSAVHPWCLAVKGSEPHDGWFCDTFCCVV